jgi:arginase family enzyme
VERVRHTVAPVYPPIAAGRLAGRIVREFGDGGAGAGGGRCGVAILGLADDTGVAMNHGRVGAREGPGAFRAALARYGVAEPMGLGGPGGLGATKGYPLVFDAGDVVPGGTLEETHERVSEAAGQLAEMGMVVVGVGGGHDLTFPLVRGVSAGRERAGLGAIRHGLYVDPHLDVRAEAGSGMAFRALVERAGVRELVNVGAEGLVNSREHGEWFATNGGRVVGSVAEASEWLSRAESAGGAGVSAFVSLDLDALDGAYGPGVSAVNPNGLTPGEMAAVARAAGRAAARGTVASFDVMELNPVHDVDQRTARVAAYLFLSFLSGMAEG